ncbi:MAG: LysM peptidoglycan-binding domain-containing protein [Deltaproteobacteria bacterium]|nr:LysM peptidoglycan-binding domain-containing protein [Deltaproteobacteria bacterium]MBN2673148.1 LysM peptidoglycan-binding domain-containing protein [Deltaproteobacteria bacterium]
MSIFKMAGLICTPVCVSVLISTTGIAGDFSIGGGAKAKAGTDTQSEFNVDGDASAGADAEAEYYQEDIQPGITYRQTEQPKSALTLAAQNRTSISIGAEPTIAPETADEKMSLKKVHTVKNGDTLWDICNTYFGDPYVWPRIWSYNPSITNPNWIYPGDTLWLVPPVIEELPSNNDGAPSSPGQVAQARQAGDAILQRNRGFVDQKILEQAGVVRGAPKEITLLSQYDEAYVEFKKNEDVQVGDEFAAFRVLKEVSATDDPDTEVGKLVEILGAVRVTSYDKEKKIARVVIDESIHPIERGTMIGPVHRRFDLIPSRTNEKELKGTIVAHLDPTLLFSQHQIVFVDKGHKDGVREGNRFFAIKKRDQYKESLGEEDDNDGYPFEVLAELRVLETRPGTSTCLVTGATRTLEDGAPVEMVKGY